MSIIIKSSQNIVEILIKFLIVFFFFSIFKNIYAEEKKFEGYQVKFDYENYSEEREIAYKYIIQDNTTYQEDENSSIDRGNLGIDLYDIDGDGEKEILIYLQHPGYCGSHGCDFSILKKSIELDEKNITNYTFIEWSDDGRAGHGIIVYPNVKILHSRTGDRHDILLSSNLGSSIWKWQGNYYKYQETYEIKESLEN